MIDSNILGLEAKINSMIASANYIKDTTKKVLQENNISVPENLTPLKSIQKLNEFKKIYKKDSDWFNGTPYDLKNEPINENEMKLLYLVRSGSVIRFNIGALIDGNFINSSMDQFFTIDWGDGVVENCIGNQVQHVYMHVDDTFIPYNDNLKQVIITVRKKDSDDTRNVLKPSDLRVDSGLSTLALLAIKSAFKPVDDTAYMIMRTPNCYNLRYLEGTNMHLQQSACINNYLLKEIKANKIKLADSYQCFQSCLSLKRIDADFEIYLTNVTNHSTFRACISLEYIKNITFKNNYTAGGDLGIYSYFDECASLVELPPFTLSLAGKINASGFFSGCYNLENPLKYLTNLNQNTLNLSSLFRGCSKIVTLPETLDVSLCPNISYMFSDCDKLINPPKYIYADNNVTLAGFFYRCYSLEKTPEAIIAPKVNNIADMFGFCYELKTINFDIDYPLCRACNYFARDCVSLTEMKKKFVLNDGTYSMVSVFSNCNRLRKLPPEILCSDFPFTGLPNVDSITGVITITSNTSTVSVVSGFAKLKTIDDLTINIPNVAQGNSCFYDCHSLQTVNNLTLNFPLATANGLKFYNAYNLKSINNLYFNSPKCNTFVDMFNNCQSLDYINNFTVNCDTSKGISLYRMYNNCFSLKELPLLNGSKEIYTKASNMWETFYNARSIKEIVFEQPFTLMGGDASRTFSGCYSLERLKINITNSLSGSGGYTDSCFSMRFLDIDCNFSGDTTFLGCISVAPGIQEVVWNSNRRGSGVTLVGWNSKRQLRKIHFKNINFGNNIQIEDCTSLNDLVIQYTTSSPGELLLRNNNLSAEALNKLFTELPTISTSKKIYIKGNPGIDTCNTAIATNKKWVVDKTT